VPIPLKFRAPFYPGNDYHLLFKSIDGVKFFHKSDDRLYYLQQFNKFMQPVANCFAYALLDNHSHFILRIKPEKELLESIMSIPQQFRTKQMKAITGPSTAEAIVSAVVERQVNSFMASYAIVINKANARKGGLFQSPFRRSLIAGDQHLQQAIIYTHANAQKHGLVKDFRQYPFTSFNEIVAGNSRFVYAKFVLDFFGGREEFIKTHKSQVDFFYKNHWPVSILEKDQ